MKLVDMNAEQFKSWVKNMCLMHDHCYAPISVIENLFGKRAGDVFPHAVVWMDLYIFCEEHHIMLSPGPSQCTFQLLRSV